MPTQKVVAQGAEIEIVERSKDAGRAIVPNAVRINGTEILIPADTTIQVSEISEHSLVTVTVTLIARSLSIQHEPEPGDAGHADSRQSDRPDTHD